MNFQKMSEYLDTFYREKNIPGVGCAVYYNHEPVFEHYAGFADVENRTAFGADTIFNLYSATKLITCAGALRLVEAGKLRLDAPLHEYIPEYRRQHVRYILDNGDSELRDAETAVTIEHLFSMAGGISGNREAEAVRKVVAGTDGRAPTLQVIRAMAAEPLLFEPGSRFKYGICHDVLGAVIEVVTGKRLGEYLKDEILDPLGMEDTSFDLLADKAPRMARLYVGFDGRTGTSREIGETIQVKVGSEYESGGGGLVSTVKDYILFAEALCNRGVAPNGYRVLRGETIDDMRANRLRGRALRDFEEFGGWSKAGYGYGLGCRTLMDRERNHSLSRNGEFGWDGARGCYALIDPDAGLALFYAQQEGGSRWWEWHGTVRNYAYASSWN